jgi:hypothetical protein
MVYSAEPQFRRRLVGMFRVRDNDLFPFIQQESTPTEAILEARVGFEPTDGGFADLSLRPLGYRAGINEYSETAIPLSVTAPIKKI